MYYRGNGTQIYGSTNVMRYTVDRIPAVVDTTSTGVLWEWELLCLSGTAYFGLHALK